MNPREFCRERTYHKALFLTYSFDPIFFEQVVLPDLWVGRSSDILVLGDINQINNSIQSVSGQLSNLGRHYLLANAGTSGAFHPKVCLRLGPRDGVVMLGSGNVTSSGWGGNQELGTAWKVGPDHPDKGGWLHTFLDIVYTWCQSDLERGAIQRFKDVPWLSLTSSEEPETTPVLYSRRANSLAPQLAQRWLNRRFNEVKILTGSTDESGAFLRWLHEAFCVTRATIALTPSSASFVAEKLATLPLEVRLVEAPKERPLHAKFYWLEGPDGAAAAMGSANCSAAAWLLSPDSTGNIETIVVYDQPEAEGFEDVLKVFNEPSLAPSELLIPRPTPESTGVNESPRYVLNSLKWNSATHQLFAEIVPTPDLTATVELLIGGRRFPMAPSDDPQTVWICELIEGLDATTVFASITVAIDSEHWTTANRWVDDIAALEHASHTARLLEPIKALVRDSTTTEQRQILHELNEVAQAILNDTGSFRDPSFREKTQSIQPDAPVEPVNPADLLVHLDESTEQLSHIHPERSGSLSLTGILRLLFDAEMDGDQTPEASGDEDIDEGQIPEPPPTSEQSDQIDLSKDDKDGPSISEQLREKLASQIDTFLADISSKNFAERCTATQMVQAVSFPLAVALRGRRGGWIDDELAERWALEIFSILFRSRWAKFGGLLKVVEQRYVQKGQEHTFKQVLGDGTLWLVLVATLGDTVWHGNGAGIEKAVAIRDVFNARQLLASANPARISGLLGKIQIADAREYVTRVAPTIDRLLDEIEHALEPVWESKMYDQAQRKITYMPGDLLWRSNVGWAVCLEKKQVQFNQSFKARLRGFERDVMAGYYVNVSEFCKHNVDLSRLVLRLQHCVATTMSGSGK